MAVNVIISACNWHACCWFINEKNHGQRHVPLPGTLFLYMKRSDKAVIFIVPASILVLLGVFARPLGLSELSGLLIFLMAMVFLLLGYREVLKARESGQLPAPTEHQQTRRFWLLVGTDGLACIALPFVLRFTGLNLPLSQRIIISAVAFIICVGVSWFGTRKGLGMTRNH